MDSLQKNAPNPGMADDKQCTTLRLRHTKWQDRMLSRTHLNRFVQNGETKLSNSDSFDNIIVAHIQNPGKVWGILFRD